MKGMALAPRFVEPCRLTVDFLSRSGGGRFDTRNSPFDSGSPILGWLVLDKLTGGLMIYTADGDYLGKIFQGDNAGKLTVEPAPGSGADPLRDYGELSSFIGSLQMRGSEDLQDFFQCIAHSPGVINPGGNGLLQQMALFVGKPVALVKARIGLEFMQAHATSYTGKSAASLEGLDIPLRLGDCRHMNEGIIGFFRDDAEGFSRFNNCVGISNGGLKGDFVFSNDTITLRLSRSLRSEVPLTLLMDAASPLHVISGLLPVKTARVPENIVKSISDKVRLVCTAQNIPGPLGSLELPFWQSDGVDILWFERESDGKWTKPAEPVNPPTQAAPPDDAVILRSGVLVHIPHHNSKDIHYG
jgi:hypothetical protein